jgi:hypothetical protein
VCAAPTALCAAQVLPLPAANSSITTVVFHSEDGSIFLVASQRAWTIYVFCPITARGPEVVLVHACDAPSSLPPLLLSHSTIAFRTDGGLAATQPVPELQEFDPDAPDYDAVAHVR